MIFIKVERKSIITTYLLPKNNNLKYYMLILHIMIDDDIFELLSKFIINNYYLINIFNEGICITQNLNKTSNLSIFQR